MNAGITDSVSQNIISSLGDVCRLCGTNDSKLIDIYSEEGLQNDIPNKIKLYIPFQLSSSGEESVDCCLECISTVLSWHEFVKKALETSQRYKSLYDKLEVVSQDLEITQHQINEHMSTITDKTTPHNSLEKLNVATEQIEQNDTNEKTSQEVYAEIKSIDLLLKLSNESMNNLEDIETSVSSHVFQSENVIEIRKNEIEDVKKFLCEICSKRFTRKYDMIRHARTKHLNVNFDTSHSPTEGTVPLKKSEIFIDQIEQDHTCMRSYEAVHPLDPEKQLLNRANEVSDILHDTEAFESINNHQNKNFVKIRRKKLDIEYRFFCDKCNKGFTRRFDLGRHVTSKHPDVKFDDSFSRKKNSEILNKCRIIENGKTIFECDVCKHRTKQSYNLLRHRTIHSGVKPYVCHICGRRFRLETAFRRHINQFHEGVKKYKCEVCLKYFGIKSARDEHMNIHFDARPFSCDICQKSFKQKSSMYVHKLYHTDNYKYSCQLCERKFRRSQELVHHNRLHTGQKPFACDACGARFRLGQDLKKHKSVHLRNDQKWVCGECSATFSKERFLKLHRKIHI